jgi:hypothetical protein
MYRHTHQCTACHRLYVCAGRYGYPPVVCPGSRHLWVHCKVCPTARKREAAPVIPYRKRRRHRWPSDTSVWAVQGGGFESNRRRH